MREREVHVVAAEQQVVADGEASEREVAFDFADFDEREVRGAAAEVGDEDEISDADVLPPAFAERIEPRIEGRLRFFEQREMLEPGGLRSLHGEVAGGSIERRRHR